MKLIEIILNEMSDLSKPQKTFFIIVIKMILSIQGKINFRNLSRYSGLAEKTFHRWFKRPFDFVKFNTLAIQKLIGFQRFVCAVDAVFLAKAGKKTYGLDYFWNGCASRSEKGLEISLTAIIDVEKKIAFPLEAKQTPSSENIKLIFNNNEATRIDFYLDHIKSILDNIKKFTTIMVCDGFYAKKKFVDGIVDMGLIFVGKIRIDANLKKIYKGETKKSRGRPKKFDGKCDLTTLEGFTLSKDIDEQTKLYEGIFYHVSLERNVKVVAVTQTKKEQKLVALLFSTNVDFEAHEIYLYYTARFQIEFIFRDAQQFTGLGHCQSRQKEALNFHINASFTAITIVKIQELLEQKKQPERNIFSMLSHKIKNHNETLISRFFSMLDFDLTLIKSHPKYYDALNYGVISIVDS